MKGLKLHEHTPGPRVFGELGGYSTFSNLIIIYAPALQAPRDFPQNQFYKNQDETKNEH